MLTPCGVCRKWTSGQWSYVEETVAREEAKAFLKASESRTGGGCSGEAVPPTDVLGKRPDRPVHDISISPLSCNNVALVASTMYSSPPNRSPDARRREEALAYARQVGSLADPTTLMGQGYASSPPRGGTGESNPPKQESLTIQQTPVICHTEASASMRAYTGDGLRACSDLPVLDPPGREAHGTPICGQPQVAYTVRVDSRKSLSESRPLTGASHSATHLSDDRGGEVHPSTATGNRVPCGVGSDGLPCYEIIGVPTSNRQPSQAVSTAVGTPVLGLPAAVDGISRYPGRPVTGVEWPIAERPLHRTGPVILTESRRRTATATATRPVPWTGDRTDVLATDVRSPILTPGHGGILPAMAGARGSPLPLLHLDDVSAGLRSFETPVMERYVRRSPPGFVAPLTPRERMARTRRYADLFDSPVERAIVAADESWRDVAGQDSSTGDAARSVSGDSQASAGKVYLPFASKIALVRDILGEKVPVSVECREANLAVTSLLSRHEGGRDLNSDRLPLAAVVRSALQVTSEAIRTATTESSSGPKSPTDGCPLGIKTLKGVAKYYQVSSPDFSVHAATVPQGLAWEQQKPQVVVSSKTIKSMEEHSRLGLACASTSEWLLAAVSSILHGCQQSLTSVESLEELRESVGTALNSSLDLLSSAGRSVQDGTVAMAANLGELSLARRDAMLRSLGTASETFKEKLRNAPIVSPHEPTELPSAEAASDLFGGLTSGLREDRQVEASSRSTELILKAYYGKDVARVGQKRQSSPRRSSQAKRPRVASSYRQAAPQPVAQPEQRPFSGPPEYRKSRGAKAPRGSFPRGRGGNRSGRR